MGTIKPSDERLWHLYAVAAIAAGHRNIASIDEIATDATLLHRRRFADREDDEIATDATPPDTTGAPAAPPVATGTLATDPPNAPATSATTPDTTTTTKPAKAKDAR